MVFWVFGYGSLVWNPGFEYDEKVIGFIKDYRRVFYLACIDHRGTPKILRELARWSVKKGQFVGVLHIVFVEALKRKKLAMERRECEYDQKTHVKFYKEGDSLRPAFSGVLVFTSTSNKENKYYLEPTLLEDMARQIATACGPCGNNRDYIFLLEKAMYDIGHEDDLVIELANEVRKVLATLGNVQPKNEKLVGQ